VAVSSLCARRCTSLRLVATGPAIGGSSPRSPPSAVSEGRSRAPLASWWTPPHGCRWSAWGLRHRLAVRVLALICARLLCRGAGAQPRPPPKAGPAAPRCGFRDKRRRGEVCDPNRERAKRSRIKPGERSRLGPHVRRSRRKGAPGARSAASTPGRVPTYKGGASRVAAEPAFGGERGSLPRAGCVAVTAPHGCHGTRGACRRHLAVRDRAGWRAALGATWRELNLAHRRTRAPRLLDTVSDFRRLSVH